MGWASGSTSGFGLEPAERPVSRSDGSHASIKAEFYVGAYNRLHDTPHTMCISRCGASPALNLGAGSTPAKAV